MGGLRIAGAPTLRAAHMVLLTIKRKKRTSSRNATDRSPGAANVKMPRTRLGKV